MLSNKSIEVHWLSLGDVTELQEVDIALTCLSQSWVGRIADPMHFIYDKRY